MTDKTEAQRMADLLMQPVVLDKHAMQAATELLRLDAENAALRDALADLQSSVDFYKRRCDLLQKWQSQMRDPERIIVCDILANGLVMPEGGRYALSGTAPARVPLTDLLIDRIADDYEDDCGRIRVDKVFDFARAIEAAHGITGDAA